MIGHVPKLMALWLTKFLKRPTNIGTIIIKSKRINRGAGYGVELPCEFKFQGDNYIRNNFWKNSYEKAYEKIATLVRHYVA